MTRSTRSALSALSARPALSTRCDDADRFDGSVRARRSHSFSSERSTPAAPARPVAIREPLAFRADCAVCGSPDIAADEAMHQGLWLLGECGRCGHRWTAGPFDGPLPAPASVRPVTAAFDEEGLEAPHAA